MKEMQKLTPSVRDSGALDIYKRLNQISGGKILDVGTERGDFIHTLVNSLKDYDSIFGIDISDEYIDDAKKRFTDDSVSFQTMNAETLEFNDESFDTVCISYTLHHLANPKLVLEEMYRVLKDGGTFLLQELFCDGNQTDSQLTDLLLHHYVAKIDRYQNVPHFDALSRIQIRDLISSFSFRNIEMLESTRNVGCLFCKEMDKCENPKNEIIINPRIKDIDEQLEKMVDHPDYQELTSEAHILKDKLRLYGSSTASVLFFICRK